MQHLTLPKCQNLLMRSEKGDGEQQATPTTTNGNNDLPFNTCARTEQLLKQL